MKIKYHFIYDLSMSKVKKTLLASKVLGDKISVIFLKLLSISTNKPLP